MRLTRRAWLPGAAGPAAAGALAAACGRSGPGAATPQAGRPPAGEVRGTLVFMTNQAAAPFAAVEAAVATFRQQYPQTDVQVTNVSAQSDERLQTLIAAGTPPDMFRIGGDQFARFYVLRAMLPLDPLFKRDKVDLSDFYPASLEQYRWAGRQLGMPSDYGYRMIYYNVELFRRAGLPAPPGEWNANGWTFDDFGRAARALTRRDLGDAGPQWGFVNPRASWQVWVYANGGRAIGPSHDETWINRPEAVEALQVCQDMQTRWQTGQSADEARQLPEAQAFTTGRGAMWQSSTATGTTTGRTITGFTWDVAPPPRGPKASGTRKTFGGGSGWFLAAATRAPEAAWRLYQHLLGKEAVSAMAGAGFAPIRRSVVSSPVWLDASKPPKSKRVATDGFEGIVPFAKLTTWGDWIAAANKELEGVWDGSRSAQDATAAIKTVTEPLIARHRELVAKDPPG